MVAKKTAVQQPAPSGRSGAAAGGGAERAGGTAGAATAAKAPTRTAAATKKATGTKTGSPARKAAGKTAARTAHDGEPVASKPPAGTPTRKIAARRTPAKKTTARKPPVEEAPAKKTTARKPPVEEAPAEKATARKSPVEGASAGKAAAKKQAAKKVAAEAVVPGGGAVGKKVPGKGAVREAASAGSREAGPSGSGAGGPVQDVAGHSTADDAGAVDAAAQTGVTTVGAKKTPGTATAAKSPVPKARIGAAEPGDLAVRPGEEPWTPEEVEEARAELTSEVLRLREEITSSEQSLAGLMRDSGDGAGDDDADTGTKNITREHELALAANAREMLTQFERALQRLDAGTYGLCENCGDPIGKARMQAFPRATLCVECKQKQERRY
ncbi:TraR/DksA family transcriptional regulator [Streptomyces sp. CB02400]|uniref:TraR/DksA family transcriptional regulator n=1 Tax=Streptomyces sp. CB02400 TaxID=1703944 RepID=UPI00093CAA73|nr:TraR/DksA C4-type zinc finger protein [Streptomyces sp. CB02400]